jgi:hypothetical protein
MKRRAEFLVEKRDGRTEWLRATKLARSIQLALHSAGVDEDWRALEIASAVLMGLRGRRAAATAAGTAAGPLRTAELADAVQHVLVVTGQPAAAAAYGAVAVERSRRRQAIEAVSRSALLGAAPLGDTFPGAPLRRLPAE